jgi:DNA-binding response OmpR family regulator
MSVNFTCGNMEQFNVCNANARSMLEVMGFNGSGYLDVVIKPTPEVLDRVRRHLTKVRKDAQRRPSPHIIHNNRWEYRHGKYEEVRDNYESCDHALSPCVAAKDYELLAAMLEFGIREKKDLVLD